MKNRHFISPLIYTILPTLSLYSHNAREAWPTLMIRPFLYSLFFAIISWISIALIMRHKRKASIFTSIWIILFFSYGHIYLFFDHVGIFKIITIDPHLLLMGIYFIILLGVFLFLWKTNKALKSLTTFLNISSLIILAINIIQLIPFEFNRLQALTKLNKYMSDQHLINTSYQNDDRESYPDIYYFVFDRYASKSTLTDYFEYDNTPFLDSLAQKNFLVADRSIANYPVTFLSLSSSLNMTHLNFLKDVLGEEYSDRSVVYEELIKNNQVVHFLKNKDYKFYQLGSSFEPTKYNTLATANYNLFLDINEFELFLYENTLFNAVVGKLNNSQQIFTSVKILETQSKDVLYKKQKIEELTKIDGPKFVFSHFLLPHPPNLYADDCQALSFDQVRQQTEDAGYINQLKCANKIMDEISTYILANRSQRPVVIIFQSDEGPYIPFDFFDGTKYVETSNKDAYKIHPRILNAWYLSDKNQPNQTANYDEIGIAPDVTLVNTFRLLFNYYFDTNYNLLENRSYIFTDDKKPYLFTEITDFAKYQPVEDTQN